MIQISEPAGDPKGLAITLLALAAPFGPIHVAEQTAPVGCMLLLSQAK